jgi:hypothetical protein
MSAAKTPFRKCSVPSCMSGTKGEFCEEHWRVIPRDLRQKFLAAKKDIQTRGRLTGAWKRAAAEVLAFFGVQP